MTVCSAPVLARRELAPGIFDFTIHCPAMAAQAVPGQFVNIAVPGHTLRRPISICGIDSAAGTLRLVMEVRGEGTQLLSQVGEGQTLDVLGPLGHGFALLEPDKRAIVVGGGIGVPPLLAAASHYGKNAVACLGFRGAGAVILGEDFAQAGVAVHLATDDGSLGHHGLVTNLLAVQLDSAPTAIVYACGPKPMLGAVAALCAQRGVRCQVSMEERMGCGVGACLVCACRMKTDDGSTAYRHVCKDGPVFEAGEVDLT